MILAVMGAAWRALFFILAIACFLGSVFHPNDKDRIRLLGLGLALFVLVFAYDAVAAA